MEPNAIEAARVLVVDDNAFVRRVIVDRLVRAGYEVREARDGAEALAVFRREPVPVVITDLNMPRLHGFDLLASLRRQKVPPEVILLTGTHAGDAAAAVQALRLGALDFIAKDALASEAVVLAVERALEKWRLREENTRLLHELQRQSVTDELTGVGNRRSFDQAVQQEIARARRSVAELSLVLMDLDYLKHINDVHGHAAGDCVLTGFTARLRATSRGSDRLFRYGGDEFALLLGDTGAVGALAVAQRAVAAVAREPVATERGAIAVTCSAGVARLLPSDDALGSDLVARADAGLYAAKGAGRNRASYAPPDIETGESNAPLACDALRLGERC
jgi:diguanylate cyclase (GGDEF)-like protein